MNVMTVEQFHAQLRAQGVPEEHLAFVCPMCKTVQSIASLARWLGDSHERAEKYVGFSCIGRLTDAGPYKNGTPPGKGCDWTLGGLLTIHRLVVRTEDGKEHPHFEIATREEALALMAEMESGVPS
jgi:hypothetical protein